MVKADAYGLGLEIAARALANAGARTFFTATLGEALRTRALLGEGPRIVALSGLESGPQAFCEAGIVPTVNSAAEAAIWAGLGPLALHLDTGMSRLGAPPEEDGAIRAALGPAAPSLVLSHLACSGDPAHPMNARQRARFVERIAGFGAAARSLSATGGALLGRDFAFDLVRIGIGLYGGGLGPHEPALRAAARLTAPVLQIRDIQAGESVGYDATFRADRAMRVATLGAGYADGILRSLSGRGYGVFRGRICPVLGRVSMDLITIDASGADDLRPGDAVELLGPAAPLASVAQAAGTASYEILTSLSRVARQTGPIG